MSITRVQLQPEVEDSLEHMASTLQRSKNWLVNEAIREFAARQEIEQQRWNETLVALDSVAQGKVISGEVVHAWLRSWGTDNELPPPKIDDQDR